MKRSLAAMIAAIIVFVIVPGAAIIKRGMEERIFDADVCVVIGSRLASDGSVPPRLAARLDRALELYREGRFRTIIACGDGAEADAMSAYLSANGVPAGRVITFGGGENTRATSEYVAHYMSANGLSRAIVITQFYHVPRAVMTLRSYGDIDVGCAYARYHDVMDVPSTLREIPAFFAYSIGLK